MPRLARTSQAHARPSSTLESGGEFTDVLVLLESVILGITLMAVKLGGDEIVLDTVMDGVKKRLAEKRLTNIETKGHA